MRFFDGDNGYTAPAQQERNVIGAKAACKAELKALKTPKFFEDLIHEMEKKHSLTGSEVKELMDEIDADIQSKKPKGGPQ